MTQDDEQTDIIDPKEHNTVSNNNVVMGFL